MSVVDMLVDLVVGNEILSLLDGYNQIYIIEQDILKTALIGKFIIGK